MFFWRSQFRRQSLAGETAWSPEGSVEADLQLMKPFPKKRFTYLRRSSVSSQSTKSYFSKIEPFGDFETIGEKFTIADLTPFSVKSEKMTTMMVQESQECSNEEVSLKRITMLELVLVSSIIVSPS